MLDWNYRTLDSIPGLFEICHHIRETVLGIHRVPPFRLVRPAQCQLLQARFEIRRGIRRPHPLDDGFHLVPARVHLLQLEFAPGADLGADVGFSRALAQVSLLLANCLLHGTVRPDGGREGIVGKQPVPVGIKEPDEFLFDLGTRRPLVGEERAQVPPLLGAAAVPLYLFPQLLEDGVPRGKLGPLRGALLPQPRADGLEVLVQVLAVGVGLAGLVEEVVDVARGGPQEGLPVAFQVYPREGGVHAPRVGLEGLEPKRKRTQLSPIISN